MELEFSDEDLREITLVSFHYFYNPSKYSTELNVMSHYLQRRISHENPNSLIERGIITALSYFLDAEFIVRCDPFPANLPPFVNPVQNIEVPPMPMNWRNYVNTHANNNAEAEYFVRQKNQVYTVHVFYHARKSAVFVNVEHITVNHEPLCVKFREAELLGLSDPQHATAFALYFIDECTGKYKSLIMKAVQDQPPTVKRTPLH